MLDSLMKNTGKTIKYIFGAGFIGAILLVAAMKGCSTDFSTNKYDATNTKTVVSGSIELQKMENKKQEILAENIAIEKSAEASAKSKIKISDNETQVELKKTLDITAIEEKKLEMQDKSILDVNKSEEMKMQLEMKKLELIEAQKLKNEFEIEKLKLDNAKAIKTSEAESKAISEKAKADAVKAKAIAASNKVKADLAEKKRKEQEEIDILKSIAN